MVAVYFEDPDNKPRRKQWHPVRRGQGPSGAIVLHTTEGAPDLKLPDTGTLGLARFIRNRSEAGSYHLTSDSDDWMQLGKFEWQMFGEGTGGNRWAIHHSWVCRAGDWPNLPNWWIDGAMENGAAACREAANWLAFEHNIIVPAKRINRDEYFNGEPGFITHGEIDPARRSDPGTHFPWDRFKVAFEKTLTQGVKPSQLDRMADRLWTLEAITFFDWAWRYHKSYTATRPTLLELVERSRTEGIAKVRWEMANSDG